MKSSGYLTVLLIVGVLLSGCKADSGREVRQTTYNSEGQESCQESGSEETKAVRDSDVVPSEETDCVEETEARYYQEDGIDYEKVTDLIDGQYHWASAVGEGSRWFVNLDSGERLEARRWDNLYYSAGDYLIFEYDGIFHVAEKTDLYHPVLSYPAGGTYGIINKVSRGYAIADCMEYKVDYYDESFQKIKTVQGVRAGENGNYYSNGLMAVRDMDTGLMGFLDEEGEMVIPCQYGYASDFANGYCSVLTDARLVFYTEDNGTVPMFDAKGGRWAIIDTEGNYAVEPSENYANKPSEDEEDYYCGGRRFSEVKSDGTVDFLDIGQNRVIETIQIIKE